MPQVAYTVNTFDVASKSGQSLPLSAHTNVNRPTHSDLPSLVKLDFLQSLPVINKETFFFHNPELRTFLRTQLPPRFEMRAWHSKICGGDDGAVLTGESQQQANTLTAVLILNGKQANPLALCRSPGSSYRFLSHRGVTTPSQVLVQVLNISHQTRYLLRTPGLR